MSLIPKVEKTSISSDCGTMVITDITGAYNASTNPGGYGAPNELRSNLYLKLIVSLRPSTGREAQAIPSYNENTASTWTITTITADGWYEIYMFLCKAWSSGTTYALNYITYDVATDTFYKSIQSGNLNHAVTDPAWWVATTDILDFAAATALSQANTYDVTDNVVELCRSKKCEGKMLLKSGCNCCDECALQEYEKVRMKIESAGWNEALGSFTEAQEIVENLNLICENLEDCGCN